MRRFLICSAVHGKIRSFDWLRRAVEHRRPDAILFAGDVLDSVRRYAPRSTLWDMTHEDAQFVDKFFEVLGGLNVFTAVVPGPADTPIEEFLRIGMAAEIRNPNVHVVHATLVEARDIAVAGMGGCLAEEDTRELESCSRTYCEYFLRTLNRARQPRKILLLGSYPPGPIGDADGSILAADLIDSLHPTLCVVAGPHSSRGIQRLGRTLIVNPGHLAEGCAAWVDLNREGEDQVEFLHVRTDQTAEIGVCD